MGTDTPEVGIFIYSPPRGDWYTWGGYIFIQTTSRGLIHQRWVQLFVVHLVGTVTPEVSPVIYSPPRWDWYTWGEWGYLWSTSWGLIHMRWVYFFTVNLKSCFWAIFGPCIPWGIFSSVSQVWTISRYLHFRSNSDIPIKTLNYRISELKNKTIRCPALLTRASIINMQVVFCVCEPALVGHFEV